MIGKFGEDEGARTGPRLGDGATISAPDSEGTPPQELPNLRGMGRLAPGEAGNLQGGRWTWLAALAATLAVLLGLILVASAVVRAG
jgi:hypothetical protein